MNITSAHDLELSIAAASERVDNYLILRDGSGLGPVKIASMFRREMMTAIEKVTDDVIADLAKKQGK